MAAPPTKRSPWRRVSIRLKAAWRSGVRRLNLCFSLLSQPSRRAPDLQAPLGDGEAQIRRHEVNAVSSLQRGPDPGPLRRAMQLAYGVHSQHDLLEKWVRLPTYLRPPPSRLRPYVARAVRDRGLLFIHVPKNSGTSIATVLYGAMLGHKTALFHQTVDPELFERAAPFATLRDPVDRFISAYWYIRRGGGSHSRMSEWFARSCKQIASVDDLLDYIEEHWRDLFVLDHVLRPQVWYLQDKHGRLVVDRLFVLGQDDERLAEFLGRYGVAHIPVLNTTDKGELTLTPSQRARVLALYADDVELLNRLTPRADFYAETGDLQSA